MKYTYLSRNLGLGSRHPGQKSEDPAITAESFLTRLIYNNLPPFKEERACSTPN